MKHILFIMFLLSIFSCTKHNGYSLSGEVPEAWEGKPVFLMLMPLTVPKYQTGNSSWKENLIFPVIAAYSFTWIPITVRIGVNWSISRSFLTVRPWKRFATIQERLPCSTSREAILKMLSKIIQIRYNLFKPIARKRSRLTPKPITMVTTWPKR